MYNNKYDIEGCINTDCNADKLHCNNFHEGYEQFKNILKEMVDKKEEIKYHDFAFSLLRDGGVKSKIIKKYLPLINQQVNRYLQMMDFYINFKLDEEFTETVESPVHDIFTYSSF